MSVLRTCISICFRSQPPSAGLLPLPISKTAYQDFAAKYLLSNSFLAVLDTGMATVCQTPVSHGEEFEALRCRSLTVRSSNDIRFVDLS
jgi:hypothetical protein